ncbi:hypothetical protein BDP27DRAFT_1371828 [Rhodocollybia butyracea]|uniref:Uncharacterized protein n=1 Tax=Rhodocollybia butyracea TaxID=206335 RepID=A0A9P5PBK8_9AGAR|nr:hypothetical protein BDP27DRAFT_1371828 [Rhodocollybia butyracea]
MSRQGDSSSDHAGSRNLCPFCSPVLLWVGLRFFESTLKKKYVNGKGHGGEKVQLWNETLRYSRHMVNAHILGVVGTSKPLSSDVHYIAFDGQRRQDNNNRITDSEGKFSSGKNNPYMTLCLKVPLTTSQSGQVVMQLLTEYSCPTKGSIRLSLM